MSIQVDNRPPCPNGQTGWNGNAQAVQLVGSCGCHYTNGVEYVPPDDRICKEYERGVHIPLTCVNHTGLMWNTKNIECIGARTIFFSTPDERECGCSARDLRVILPSGELQAR